MKAARNANNSRTKTRGFKSGSTIPKGFQKKAEMKTENVDEKLAPETLTSQSTPASVPIDTKCKSIRSKSESHLRCTLRAAPDSDFCPLHEINPISYIPSLADTAVNTLMADEQAYVNPSDRVVRVSDVKKEKLTLFGLKTAVKKSEGNSKITSSSSDKKVSTLNDNFIENEEQLEVKLLILTNEYSDQLKELIGPVYDSLLLSEDDTDPISGDEIWTYEDGEKVPGTINKFYLFSYLDSNSKIRCFTVFTLKMILDKNDYKHPFSSEPIPESEIARGKRLVDFYHEKIDLFNETPCNSSPEFILENRIIKLFKTFEAKHTIFFERSWLLNMNSLDSLKKVIVETEKILRNNLQAIVTDRAISSDIFATSMNISKISNIQRNPFSYKEYIVESWEFLISKTCGGDLTSPNQAAIWMIALGLLPLVPEIETKFPGIRLMLN